MDDVPSSDIIEKMLLAAHDAAFRMSEAALCDHLAKCLGRYTVARLAGAPDVNTVSRWATGRCVANEVRLDRMRHAAYIYNALVAFGFRQSSARQWFRSPHPAVRDETPMDLMARGELRTLIAALRHHATFVRLARYAPDEPPPIFQVEDYDDLDMNDDTDA